MEKQGSGTKHFLDAFTNGEPSVHRRLRRKGKGSTSRLKWHEGCEILCSTLSAKPTWNHISNRPIMPP
jgi:hypothetical protein